VKWLEGAIDLSAAEGDGVICNPAVSVCAPSLCGVGVLPAMIAGTLLYCNGRRRAY